MLISAAISQWLVSVIVWLLLIFVALWLLERVMNKLWDTLIGHPAKLLDYLTNRKRFALWREDQTYARNTVINNAKTLCSKQSSPPASVSIIPENMDMIRLQWAVLALEQVESTEDE